MYQKWDSNRTKLIKELIKEMINVRIKTKVWEGSKPSTIEKRL